jgi:hypothetical protein
MPAGIAGMLGIFCRAGLAKSASLAPGAIKTHSKIYEISTG